MISQSLTLTLEMRPCLALRGGMLGSCLPRTESALKRSRAAQRALGRLGIGEYQSLPDAFLGLCSAHWDRQIRRYYGEAKGPQMVEGWSQATIAHVDAVLAHVATELATLGKSWPTGRYHDRALRDALRTFAGPHLPTTEPTRG